MNRKGYMKPSMTAVKIQSANKILTVSEDVGLHNELSSNRSYVRESIWNNELSNTGGSIWDEEW